MLNFFQAAKMVLKKKTLPCTCGGTDLIVTTRTRISCGSHIYKVTCPSCGKTSPFFDSKFLLRIYWINENNVDSSQTAHTCERGKTCELVAHDHEHCSWCGEYVKREVELKNG